MNLHLHPRISIGVQKTLIGWRGFIRCKIGTRVLWGKTYPCIRLSHDEALADARRLKQEA